MNQSVTHKAQRRGRPRTRAVDAANQLVRRNLLVNREALEQLRRVYGVSSESEAVRRAVDLALLADEAESLGEWFREHGSPEDVYGRTTGQSRLPVHLTPNDVIEDEEDDTVDVSGP